MLDVLILILLLGAIIYSIKAGKIYSGLWLIRREEDPFTFWGLVGVAFLFILFIILLGLTD